jgi:hypothetical protein
LSFSLTFDISPLTFDIEVFGLLDEFQALLGMVPIFFRCGALEHGHSPKTNEFHTGMIPDISRYSHEKNALYFREFLDA